MQRRRGQSVDGPGWPAGLIGFGDRLTLCPVLHGFDEIAGDSQGIPRRLARQGDADFA